MFRNDEFEKLTFLKQNYSNIQNFKKLTFFASFLFKRLINSWVTWIVFNFHDYSYFQQKIRGCNNMRHPVHTLFFYFFFHMMADMSLGNQIKETEDHGNSKNTASHYDKRIFIWLIFKKLADKMKN